MHRYAIGMVVAGLSLAATVWAAPEKAETRLLLPLNRTAYQTNEMIDIAVLRHDGSPLPAGDLTITLSGIDNGSAATVTFPVNAIAIEGDSASAAEHFQINGRLLRPGRYDIRAKVDGRESSATIDVHSHIRRSTFRTIDWGSAQAEKISGFLGKTGLDSTCSITPTAGWIPTKPSARAWTSCETTPWAGGISWICARSATGPTHTPFSAERPAPRVRHCRIAPRPIASAFTSTMSPACPLHPNAEIRHCNLNMHPDSDT